MRSGQPPLPWSGRPSRGARGTAAGPLEGETGMSIKSRILAATAALTVVGGLGTVGAMSASAATPPCGHRCIDIFSREFGTHSHPNFVLDVWRQTARAGTPIILYRSSNTDKAQDFTISNQGTVGDFYAAGLVSASLNLHYSNDQAYE